MSKRLSAEKYLQPGDLIFVSGKGPMSWTIQLGTLSLPNVFGLGKRNWAGFSHVGIMANANGHLVMYESTSKFSKRPPCVRHPEHGPHWAGVQAHRIQDILSSDSDVWHYPLRSPLYQHESARLTSTLEVYMGRGYDFLGAGWAWGGPVRRAVQALVRPQNLDLLFCSELCMAALASVGRLRTKSASVWSPTQLARHVVREGVCESGGLLSY